MIVKATLPKVQTYIDRVQSGDIVVCKLVKAAVDRHLNDLKRIGTPGFPYYFNEDLAQYSIDFCETIIRHSTGQYAGKNFFLEDWQAFGTAMIDGWRCVDNDARRFRTVMWSQARKNGKSFFAASRCYFSVVADPHPTTRKPEENALVVLSATRKEQAAKVIFKECKLMRKRSPELLALSTAYRDHIEFKETNSEIMPVGSDKSYDGLNPTLVSIDEQHAFREVVHSDFLATMRTGGGSRMQPLTLITTTAGSDRSTLWLADYKYAKSVVLDEFKDDRWFVYIFEIDEDDDPLDESTWIKANPNLGVSVSLEYLRDNAAKTRGNPKWLNEFTRYHCNRIVSATEQAFDLGKWDDCAGELSDWHEADAVAGGVDLGGQNDFAAIALCARFQTEESNDEGIPIYRYELRTWSYIAEDTTRDLTLEPFATWVHLDLLKKSKYPIAELTAKLLEQCRTWRAYDVAYDPYSAQPFAETLQREGVVAAAFPQNTAMFNEPIRAMMEMLADGRLKHDGNPLLRWCVSNAALITDHQNRVMYTKRDSAGKIDPLVAATQALRRAMLAPVRCQGPLIEFT